LLNERREQAKISAIAFVTIRPGIFLLQLLNKKIRKKPWLSPDKKTRQLSYFNIISNHAAEGA
jgi:hypothetical protein